MKSATLACFRPKILRKTFFIIVGLCSAISCSPYKPPKNGTVNGQDADKFYNQYIYTPENVTGYFNYLTTGGFKLWDMGGGKSVGGVITVFLLKNKQFTLVYEENVTCALTTGPYSIRTYKVPIQGTWTVDNAKIVLGNVGEIAHTTSGANVANGGATLQIKMYKDLHVQGLASKGIWITYQRSLQSMESLLDDNAIKSFDQAMQTLNTYCKN